MVKISALTELTNLDPTDQTPIVDDSADTTKYYTIATLLKKIYPVGSTYTNVTDSTSPATLFGFGTWVRIKGRVIVGLDEADPDFDTPGETGGQKDVMAHAHNIVVKNDDFNHSGATGQPGPSFDSANDSQPAFQSFGGIVASTGTGTNNMNPYKAAYVWYRTA